MDVNVSGAIEVSTLGDEELESRTRARLVALGVEVAGPMLMALPGIDQTTAPSSEPEPAPDPDPAEGVEPAGPGRAAAILDAGPVAVADKDRKAG